MPDEYAAFILLLMFSAPVLWSIIDKAAAKKLEPFELELYKRCQKAGVGDAVNAKDEIQKAGELAQTLASEKEFSRKIKKRHLKAEWLNKRLKNGKILFAQEIAQETEARQRAEEARRRIEAARQRDAMERVRLFNALPHSWNNDYGSTYTLWYDSIEEIDRGKLLHSLQISKLDKVIIEDFLETQLKIRICSNNLSFVLVPTIYCPTDAQMLAIYTYLVKYSAMPEEAKARLLSNPNDLVRECKRYYHDPKQEYYDLSQKAFIESVASLYAYGSGKSKNTSKNASVVGRAAAGWAIAGPAGGVIGALSAVDKNNKNNKK